MLDRVLRSAGLALALGAMLAMLAPTAVIPTVAASAPCLPPGMTMPPGVPALPTCTTPPTKGAKLRIEVRGGFVAQVSGHQGDRSTCGPQAGGWSTFTGRTELDFGPPKPITTIASLDKAKHLVRFGPAEAPIRVTVAPSASGQHGDPPDCLPHADVATCAKTVEGGAATLSGLLTAPKDVPETLTVSLTPVGTLNPGCPAPLEDGLGLGTLTFRHELTEAEGGATALVLGPKPKKGSHRSFTFEWSDGPQPCSAYGVPATLFDTCTISADFSVTIVRLT